MENEECDSSLEYVYVEIPEEMEFEESSSESIDFEYSLEC